MKYRATITIDTDITQIFDTLEEAARWLDSMNDDLKYDSVIEKIDEHEHITDSLNYTRK